MSLRCFLDRFPHYIRVADHHDVNDVMQWCEERFGAEDGCYKSVFPELSVGSWRKISNTIFFVNPHDAISCKMRWG